MNMLKNIADHRSGFTLIEILVAVAIIGLLTSVVLFSIGDVRSQSRDKSRQVDLKQLELVMELYREANGEYPAPDPGCGVNPGDAIWASPGPGTQAWYQECADYIDGLAPAYISVLANDPIDENDPNNGFMYRVNANQDGYKIIVNTVESLTNSSYSDDFARCDSSCTTQANCQLAANSFINTYAVYVDPVPGNGVGPECW